MKTLKKALTVFLLVLVLGVLVSCGDKNVTVKFDAKNDTPIVEKVIKEGGTVARPADPTRDGFIFDNWYVDGEKYDFEKPIKKNVTIIAIWKKASMVTFHYYGDKIEKVAAVPGQKLSPIDVVEREGYQFLGWSRDDFILVDEWDFSVDVMPEGDLDLYAFWESIPVINGINDITYLIGDGDLDLLEGVTATDIKDGPLVVTVEQGELDLTKEGVYQVTYSAKNRVGKETVEVIEVTVMYENRLLIKQLETEQQLLLQVKEEVIGFVLEVSYLGEVAEKDIIVKLSEILVIVKLSEILDGWISDINISAGTIKIAATGLEEIDTYQLTEILTISANVELELLSLKVDTVTENNLIIK